MWDIAALGEDVLAALRSNQADVIAEQVERMRQLQTELSRSGQLDLGEVERIVEHVRGEVEARIRLDLDAQLERTQSAVDAFERERQERRGEQQKEAERRRQAAEQLMDRQQQLRERIEQERAQLTAVMFSSPRQLGTVPVASDGTATVRLPAGVRGDHHIALIDTESGVIAAWVPVTIEAAATTMPRVGAPAGPEVLALATALGISGAVVWSRASSRRRPARMR